MDREYAQMAATQAYDRRNQSIDVEAPAAALDGIAHHLDEIENGLRRLIANANGTADRIFAAPVPLNGQLDGAKTPREPVNIPSLLNRADRIRMLVNEADCAVCRFATL